MARKIVAGIMVGLLALSVSGCGEKKTEGLLIKNANIYTVDEKGTVAEAMVAKGNEIVYVGDEKGAEEFTTKKMEVVDAKGGTVMPGVVDSHMHPAKSATAYLFEIGLADLVGEEAYVKEIKKFIEENPEAEAYVGSGYMRSAWDDVGPRKEVLDKLCSDKPMIITSVDGHSVWVNSFALEKAGVTKDTADPEGGVIKRDPVTGEPSGLLQESAMALVEDQKPIYTKEQYKEGILWLQEWFNQVGLTTMFDAMIPIDNEDYYMAYQELASEGKLTMRIRGAWHMSPEMAKDMAGYEAMVDKAVEQSKKFDTAYFQVNTFKFFADQVIEEESGYLSQPYSNRTDGWTGIKVWDDEVMANLFTKIDKAGFQIHVHQIGDAAATYTLDAMEKAVAANGERDSRHTFAHVQMISDADKERMAKLKMNAVIAPYWMAMDDYYWDLYIPYIGAERADNMYPAKSLMDKGINTAIHSDFFVTEPDLGWLFYGAVVRTVPEKIFDLWYEGMNLVRTTDPQEAVKEGNIGPLKQAEERLTLEEVVGAATLNGARANFLEKEVGSIEVGKKADFILFDENLFTLDIEKVSEKSPVLTVFDGKIVYQEGDKEEK